MPSPPVRTRTLPLRRGSPHKKAGHAEAREKPDAREATFPGLAADKHEYAKTRKHAAAIFANRQGDQFVPLVVSDAGSWGPQAMAFYSRLARTAEAPARTLQK